MNTSLNKWPVDVLIKEDYFLAIFGGSFGMAQASSAGYETFSIEVHDTEGGAPELGHRYCVMTHT